MSDRDEFSNAGAGNRARGGSPKRLSLPVDAVLDAIRATLVASRPVILHAPPGTGKTTRVPPAIWDPSREGEVWVLEPRRIAARAAARRVAAERGETLGDRVGYQVRHDRVDSKATRIRFVTEGVLVRRVANDPFLTGIQCVCLDEFHERHLEGDLALAMVQEIRTTVRPDLGLVVMSATLAEGPLRAFLPDAETHEVTSPLHPVEQLHQPAAWSKLRLEDKVRRGVDQLLEATPGDVLVFLPGVGEIRAAARALGGHDGIAVMPLHGGLPKAEQDQVLAPHSQRKVVLSTNVAESSLTIPGVRAVLDSGLVRMRRFDPARGIDSLKIESISMASAVQRRGRAGREAPGVCMRLWSVADERLMSAHTDPEVQRVDMAGTVLTVRAFAARDPEDFGWFESPPSAALQGADRLLRALHALDDAGSVTREGQALLAMPLHPRLGKLVRAAVQFDVPDAGVWAAVLLAEDAVSKDLDGHFEERVLAAADLSATRGSGRRGGGSARERVADVGHALGLHEGAARVVLDAVSQMRRVAKSVEPGSAGVELHAVDAKAEDEERLGRALLAAFPDRVAKRLRANAPEAVLVGGTVAALPAGFPMDSQLAVALRLLDTGARGQQTRPNQSVRSVHARIPLAIAVEEDWLQQIPGAYARRTEAVLDDAKGRVMARTKDVYFDLVLRDVPGGSLDVMDVRELLIALLKQDWARWIPDSDVVAKFCGRVATWIEFGAPEAVAVPDNEAIATAAVDGLGVGTKLDAISSRDVVATLAASLPGGKHALDRALPESVTLPSTRRAKIDYTATGGPEIEARIQELFGMTATPGLGSTGRRLILKILGPNYRPVQITSDLKSFWANTYPDIRRELSRRYPKHAWPEDPLAATAVKVSGGGRRRR